MFQCLQMTHSHTFLQVKVIKVDRNLHQCWNNESTGERRTRKPVSTSIKTLKTRIWTALDKSWAHLIMIYEMLLVSKILMICYFFHTLFFCIWISIDHGFYYSISHAWFITASLFYKETIHALLPRSIVFTLTSHKTENKLVTIS